MSRASPQSSSKRCIFRAGSPPQMRAILRIFAASIPISQSQSILGQRSGHYADSQRFTGFSTEMAESFPDIRVLHPECSFLDESLSERIAMRAIQSDSELRGIYLTSAGREGVYRAVHAAHRSEKLHIVVHDITEGNIKMVKNGTVDFIIGQDVKTQGTLPIRLLYDYLERHQFPRERMNMTDITIKFRGNV